MEKSHLSIENVSKSFGDIDVLNNVSLTINKGKLFSILGPSGCGKTTLLRIIAGFENPDQGTITLDGDDILSKPPNKRHINTIFQNYALFPHLDVYDNIAFALRLKKYSEKQIDQEVEKYLTLARLEKHVSKYPRQLSGGQKQRVAIARALVNNPAVLLLDEPLSALDAKLRQHMLIELDTLHDKIGITFIYVTHDQTEALSVSDCIAVMNEGEILQIGKPAEIYESPANSFVADFIGETNFIKGVIRDIQPNFGTIESEELGKINFYLDYPVKINDSIKLTIRPEKIRITHDKPNDDMIHSGLIVLKGYVDEVIYTGFQSKFFIKLENRETLFKVFKQHVQFFADEETIRWKDTVYIWRNPNDSFIVEVIPE